MDSFRRDPGETSERGAKRPRLPAVFEAVKAGRFDELSLTGEIVARRRTRSRPPRPRRRRRRRRPRSGEGTQ